MFRRFFLLLLQRAFVFLVLVCLGCSAQSSTSDVNKRIERQIRSQFDVSPGVGVTVGEHKSSEFPNYENVTVTFIQGDRKQKHDFLVSRDGKSLVRFTKFDISADPYAENIKKIDIQGRPSRGAADAKVVIVNYDDFQCPYCSRMHHTLFSELMKTYGDRVRVVYKDFPLYEIHPWANHAAVDSNCLAVQNNDVYWEFADTVHADPRQVTGEKRPLSEQFAALDRIALEGARKHNLDLPRLEACVKAQKDDAVRASVKEASQLGISATPTLFINGEKVGGAYPTEQVRAVIDRALLDAGQKSPASPVSASAPAHGGKQ